MRKYHTQIKMKESLFCEEAETVQTTDHDVGTKVRLITKSEYLE